MRKNTRQIKLAILLAFVFVLLCSAGVHSAPSINKVSGELRGGETIMISGSGYGSNGPDVLYFNDFTSGAVGASLGNNSNGEIGQWTIMESSIKFTDESSVSGGQAIQMDLSDRWGYDSYIILPEGTRHVFASYWFYLPPGTVFPGYGGDGSNWKTISIWSDSQGTYWANWTMQGGANNSIWRGSFGNTYCHGIYFTNSTIGHWQREHVYITPDYINHWELRPDLGVKLLRHRDDPHNGRTVAGNILPSGLDWERLNMPHYGRTAPNSRPIYDDFYVAVGPNAQARVEIGNASVYENCTDLAISTHITWSDSQIGVVVRQGRFKEGDQAFLFVIDSEGRPSSGYPVIIGTTIVGEHLAPPINLKIQ